MVAAEPWWSVQPFGGDPSALRSAGAAGAAGGVDAAVAGQPGSVLRRAGPSAPRGERRWSRRRPTIWCLGGATAVEPDEDARCATLSRAGGYQWAELMRRTFAVDVLTCPRCGGRPCLVALIEQASVIQRILRHLELPTDAPESRPARAPPGSLSGSRISRKTPTNSTPAAEGMTSRREVCRSGRPPGLPVGVFPLPLSADSPKNRSCQHSYPRCRRETS